MKKTLVMLPTYNERENLVKLVPEILSIGPDISIIVVDDDSPDGTWKLVREMAEKDSRVSLIHRTREKGRGTAGIEGFLFAVRSGVDYVIEMDADYSHHPRYIPSLLSEMEKCDVVIGSRLIHGGKERGRNILRTLITWFANNYIRLLMGVDIMDCTSGYRCFKREVLASIGLEKMVSVGPSIVEEVLYACVLKGYRIKEIPILFEERCHGETTKTLGQYLDTALKVIRFRLRMRKELL
ncbi:MAG: polyprenol monophosphomannose synthase [Nitrospinae bacterium]|nr:polyprenol monophosphomannose synthase [Nitrospinota bacterium]